MSGLTIVHNPTSDTWVLGPFPLPPSVNKVYDYTPFYKNGVRTITSYRDLMIHTGYRKVLSKEGRQYKQTVSQLLIDSMQCPTIADWIDAHVTITIDMYIYRKKWLRADGQPNMVAGDGDNRIKILQDVLFETIGRDDCLAFRTSATKVPCDKPDMVYVILSPTPAVLDIF